jgi:hypothetical protein
MVISQRKFFFYEVEQNYPFTRINEAAEEEADGMSKQSYTEYHL